MGRKGKAGYSSQITHRERAKRKKAKKKARKSRNLNRRTGHGA